MSTDQSRPVSRVSVVEALTQIRALCDASDVLGPREFRSRVRAVLDAVSVDATPPQGIDRDALVALLGTFSGEAFGRGDIDYVDWADRILALVRPVQGVTLTPEDRDRVTGWFVKLGEAPCEVLPEDRALFARLEASS